MERWFHSLVPHASLIGLSLGALLLLFIAVAWMFKTRAEIEEGQWISLVRRTGLFEMTGTTSIMKEIAEEHPDSKAGLWALQIAGDGDLSNGLRTFAQNRTEAVREIEKAREAFRKVVDAPTNLKSPELQRRSVFSLAYAYESLGQFEQAAELYRQLIEMAPDSPFTDQARRGLARSQNPQFASIYKAFKEWEDPLGPAPGAITDQLPDLSFPDIIGEEDDNKDDSAEKPTGGEADQNDPTESSESSDATAGDQEDNTSEDLENRQPPTIE